MCNYSAFCLLFSSFFFGVGGGESALLLLEVFFPAMSHVELVHCAVLF